MSIIVIAWSLVAAIGFAIFAVQLALWQVKKSSRDSLLAAIMALATSGAAVCELVMAKATSPADIQTPMLISNLMVFLLVVPMVWFTRLRLGTGPLWLAWSITALWAVGLAVNFLLPGNLTFSSVEQLDQRMAFWGEPFSVPVGKANPFRFLSEIATLLIIIFVSWAVISACRLGNRVAALRIGGPILFFIITAGIHTVLVDLSIIKSPYMISWAFIAIAVALGMELVRDAASAARLNLDLHASEARWRVLLENIKLGVISLSVDGTITFSNEAMLSLFGRKREEIIGRSIAEFVPPSLRNDLKERIETARKAGPRARTEYPLLDADGNQHEVVWSLAGIRNEDDEISGFVAICDDVTEIRQTENDLLETRRAIEKLDRSAALSEVTAGIAHELNQPLAAILSNAQAGRRILKAEANPPDDMAEILDDIIADNKRASEVITGIRNLLAPQQGSMRPIAILDIVDDVQRILSSELLGRGVTLAIPDTSSLPPIHANKVQIEQVLLNLILNSAHAETETGTDQPRIDLLARVRGRFLAIYVIDNGPGIDPKLKDKVLQPGVTSRPDGLGMGLSISGRIVANHDGKMNFITRQNRGTVFRLLLPLADVGTK
ncbi:MAG: PAS domain S-box protein [Roseibium sp.]